jgi:hypothetical protein
MNLVDAYNITLNIGHPASIDYVEVEEEIAREVLDRYPLASVARICEAIGAGRRVFDLSANLAAAKDAAMKVMEAN